MRDNGAPTLPRTTRMPKKIEARRSAIHGNGVFATEAIAKGERVIRYKGLLRTHAEVDEVYAEEADSGHTFIFTLNDKYVIDANVDGNDARWINHSCDPNCEAAWLEHDSGKKRKDRIYIEALRDIKPGEAPVAVMMFANARNPALFFRTRPSHARPGSSVREAMSNSCPNNTIAVPAERRLIPVMRWSTLAHARSAATTATSGTPLSSAFATASASAAIVIVAFGNSRSRRSLASVRSPALESMRRIAGAWVMAVTEAARKHIRGSTESYGGPSTHCVRRMLPR